ncbi:hypothetical protein [Sphingomonas sp.]|uniref:hypothetical protein n=1 Tax=Sphingomonas sp. TaxID=28214 RepID=UPI003B00FF85
MLDDGLGPLLDHAADQRVVISFEPGMLVETVAESRLPCVVSIRGGDGHRVGSCYEPHRLATGGCWITRARC